MRYSEQTQITISEDLSTAPVNIRFADSTSDVDVANIAHLKDCTDSFPIGTTPVSMGQITLGKFLWIKSSVSVGIALSGGAPFSLIANKASKLWVSFTSLAITVPNTTQNQVTPAQVTISIGG